MVEQGIENPRVGGSIPSLGTIPSKDPQWLLALIYFVDKLQCHFQRHINAETIVIMTSQISKRVLASYSMVALPIGAMAMPIAIYMPPLYSGSLGLSLATVGLIFTLARIWDLITDPIMGVVIDRYGSRWGHYKHWVALTFAHVGGLQNFSS